MRNGNSLARFVAARAIFVSATLWSPTVASAAVCNWVGTAGTGNYFTSSNWSCGHAPKASDSAYIGGNTGLVVTAGSNVTVGALAIAAGRILTLSSNSNLSITNNVLSLNGTLNIGTGYLRNNGAENSTLVIDTADGATGAGMINLAGGNLFRGNKYSVSSRISLSGGGNIGNGSSAITNAGTISAKAALTIDPSGGGNGLASTDSTGIAGTNNATFYNSGSVIAQTGAITAASGRYQNTATGLFAARNGNSFAMTWNSNVEAAAVLSNLSTAGALLLGTYEATGSGSTLILRGPASTPGIVTIGSGSSFGTTNTRVILSGSGSTVSASAYHAATAVSIDNTLVTIAGSGMLQVLNGRGFAGASRAITNNGVLQLGGATTDADGSFTAGSLANGGQIYGHGTISVVINNTVAGSLVRASNGMLSIRGATGVGDAIADAGATLNLTTATGTSTVRNLANNGNIALGTQPITVSGDYTNAAFGSGNAFNARANTSGTGLINALSASQALSAPGLSGGVLLLPAARVGGTSQQVLTITNGGTSTTLRGAIQNSVAPLVTIGTPNFAIAPNGKAATSTIGISTATAGNYSQVITVANNFANVANANITVNAKVYAPAVATLGAKSLNFGVVRQGSAAVVRSVSITNAANGNPADTLLTTAKTLPSGVTATVPGALAAGQADMVNFTLATGMAGVVSSAATLGFASHDTELSDLTLASQNIGLSGVVTQVAVSSLFKSGGSGQLATVDGTSYILDLGDRTIDTGMITTDIGVLNAILASSYGENLVASFSGGNGGGFSFASNDLSSVAAGSSVAGNLLTFNTAGMMPGFYQVTLFLKSFSRFTGLADTASREQSIDVQISLFAPFPEPAIWAEMLAGFGLMGVALRRRRPMRTVSA